MAVGLSVTLPQGGELRLPRGSSLFARLVILFLAKSVSGFTSKTYFNVIFMERFPRKHPISCAEGQVLSGFCAIIQQLKKKTAACKAGLHEGKQTVKQRTLLL